MAAGKKVAPKPATAVSPSKLDGVVLADLPPVESPHKPVAAVAGVAAPAGADRSGDLYDDESGAEEDEQLYCVCRGPNEGFMIMCDKCDEWFHGDCVRISEYGIVSDDGFMGLARCARWP
jgi:hypothetical protein